MKKKKEIKKQKGVSFLEIVVGLLHIALFIGRLVWLVLLVASLVGIVVFAYSYFFYPERYDAANYEKHGSHTFHFKDIELYFDTFFSQRGSLGIRYKINYETTIDGEIYVYSLDDYRTKSQAIKISEENQTKTKYIYSVNTKNGATLRLSEFATAEEFVNDLSSKDRGLLKFGIRWLIICIVAFVCYKVAKHKKIIEDGQ